MKKVLLATTALFASAGFAAAEVALSGSAEIGVFGGDDTDAQFHTDVDVTFTLAGETDTGLTFGGSIDLDESDGDDQFSSPAFDNDTQGGESLFVSGQFGTLTMGDTDGALDWALSEAIIGADLIDGNEHAGYNGNAVLDGYYDGQVARYDYSFGDFAAALSLEIDDDDTEDDPLTPEDETADAGDPVIGVGLRYNVALFGIDWQWGLGYQTVEDSDNDVDADFVGLSFDATFNQIQAIVSYVQGDADVGGDDVEPSHVGVALGYTFDALTVAVNYGQYDEWVLDDNNDNSGYSLIVNYDLGGGAELQAGYAVSELDDGAGDESEEDVYSLGVSMAF